MISIITPSFNRSYIIDETAQSIFAQSDHRWEWIIVDDGSTDDSWEKIQGYAKKDDRVKVLSTGPWTERCLHLPKHWSYENRKGEYFIFLIAMTSSAKMPLLTASPHGFSTNSSTIPYFPIVTFEKNHQPRFLLG